MTFIVHSTQYTVHSTQYTVHSTQYIVHSTQYTVHSTQYTINIHTLCKIPRYSTEAPHTLDSSLYIFPLEGGGRLHSP